MNRHLNPSSEAARARLFITDNSSVIVMMAPDFAIKEGTYASQRYLIVTCDVQIHGYMYNKAGQDGRWQGWLSVWSVHCFILCYGLSVCLVCGFSVSGSPFFADLSSNLPEDFVRSAVLENPI